MRKHADLLRQDAQEQLGPWQGSNIEVTEFKVYFFQPISNCQKKLLQTINKTSTTSGEKQNS